MEAFTDTLPIVCNGFISRRHSTGSRARGSFEVSGFSVHGFVVHSGGLLRWVGLMLGGGFIPYISP